MFYFNCHTHIFNQPCAPENFLNAYVSKSIAGFLRFVTARQLTRGLLLKIARLTPVRSWKRPLSFLSVGSEQTQDLIFETLQDNYPPNTRLVVLTMNMEHMESGRCEVDYKTQLTEVLKVKKMYPHHCLPFLGVDPRMNLQKFSCNTLVDFVINYLNSGFIGIKMYPALGFYPFHSDMMPVYAFAEQNGIPILTHCDRGGAYYRKTNRLPDPPLPNVPRPWLDVDLKLSDDDFSDNFLEPQNYIEVLNRYPKLKICFAHLGGVADILAFPATVENKKNNWYQDIKDIIANPAFANVYTDLSYILYSDKAMKQVFEDFFVPAGSHAAFADRILFGTDFYMTEREKPEKDLITSIQNQYKSPLFGKIAHSNVVTYLNSTLYTF